METKANDTHSAMRRLRGYFLFGLVSMAALAIVAVGLALTALSDQAQFERRIVEAAIDVTGQQPRDLLPTLAASAERQQRYRLAQGTVLASVILLLVVGIWRITPTHLRQFGEVVRRVEGRASRWQAIHDAISDGLVILQPDARIVEMNPHAEALFGRRSSEVQGRSLQILLPEPERSHLTEVREALLTPEPVIGYELLMLHADGRVIAAELDSNPMYRDGRREYLLVIRDTSPRKEQEERQNEALFFDLLTDLSAKEETARELTRLATTDPLTGAFNRAKFDERLSQEISRCLRHDVALTLVLLDIDRFKQVNDTYGHAAGDQVLIDLSRIARSNLRAADLFARWGGEEFAILAPDTDLAGAVRLSEKIRGAVENHPFREVDHVTASFGIAEYRVGESAEEFLRRADAALYRAKESGRNCVNAA